MKMAPTVSAGLPVILWRLLHGSPLAVNPLHPRPIAPMPTAITASAPSVSCSPIISAFSGFGSLLSFHIGWFDVGCHLTPQLQMQVGMAFPADLHLAIH